MSDLKSRIDADVKDAMRSRDKDKLAALRLIMAAIKQREVDERVALDDPQVLAVLDKMAKQLRDAIAQFEAAQRHDLVAKENFELEIVQHYMPAPLSDDEIAQIIDAAVAEAGATTVKDMGKVMAILKPKVQGRADLGLVSGKVKSVLAQA